MAEATSATNAKKLDEILKRLTGQPTIEEWHDLATMLSEVDDRVKDIKCTVDKLDESVNGNGKPGLKTQVHDLERDMSNYNRLTWIVIGIGASSVVGAFIYLVESHALPLP